MSRGIRSDTLDRIRIARERDPLAIGPFLCELATDQNISAPLLAELIGTHEQTVLRWAFGQSHVQAYWMPVVAKVLMLLSWRHATGALPLTGNAEQKRAELARNAQDFKVAVKSTSRTLRSVA